MSHSTQNRSFWETFLQANLLAWHEKKLNQTQQEHAFTNQMKHTTTQNKHKKTKTTFFTTSGLEMEQVYSQRKRYVREEISKEKCREKDKSGSI